MFLYAGTHDDCFRWIERNKGLTYEVDWPTNSISIVQDEHTDADELPEDVLEEKIFVEQYEKKLMEQIDDDLLVRIFTGWCNRGQDENRKKAQ